MKKLQKTKKQDQKKKKKKKNFYESAYTKVYFIE